MRAPLLLAVFSLALSLHATTRISPEQLVAEPRPGAPRTMNESAVASDGSHALVAWTGEGGLTATIVDSDGRVPEVPRAPQILIAAEQSIRNISVAWTGSVYLVTWTSDASTGVAVRAATLSRDGILLAAPVVVAPNAVTITGALTAGTQGAFGVYLTIDTVQFRGVVFDSMGTVVKTNAPLPAVNRITDPVDLVRVISNGDGYAYVWRTSDYLGLSALSTPSALQRRYDTFFLVRLTSNGDAVGSPIRIGRFEEVATFDVAFGGGKYAFVATEQRLIAPGNVQRLLARSIIDAEARTVSPLTKVERPDSASIIWSGSTFLAYGSTPDFSGIETLAFTGSEPATLTTIPSLGLVYVPLLEPVDGKLLLVWKQNRVLGAILENNATAMSRGPFLVSVAWARQQLPSIASSRNESLVVWWEDNGLSGGRVIGRRFSQTGDVIGEPFLITEASIDEPPVVTFTGVAYQVFWRERADISGAGRVVGQSIRLDGSFGPRVDLGPGWGVTAASNDKVTLVAFGTNGIIGYRLAPTGELLDTQPIKIGDTYMPAAATNGTDFFVVWDSGHDVVGTRVTAAGAVDAAPLPIATGQGSNGTAAVASDGRDYMVFYWTANFNEGAVLASKRVLREGQLDGTTSDVRGIVLAEEPLGGYPTPWGVHAAHNANGYWLSWFDNVYETAFLRVIHTDLDGRQIETLPVFSAGYEPVAIAGIAATTGGQIDLVYARSIHSGAYVGTTQVFVRSLDETTPRRRALR